ncbi:unnamed protein product, partial [marine sediment metagenome]
MEDFIDLQSLYNHLEKNALEYKYPHQIGNLFQKLQDLKYKKDEVDEAEKAQWEIDFFSFRIIEGKLNPMFKETNEKGEIIEYPSFDEFENETFDYLVERLESTSNLLLKARYSNILWCSPKKHDRYAKIAVEYYLKLVKIYEERDRKESQKHYGLDVLKTIKNAYHISRQ